jgi:hypothetical protein
MLQKYGTELKVFFTKLGYGLYDAGFEFRQRQEIIFISKTSRLSPGSTRPLIQWVPEFSAGGKAARGVNLTTHPDLAPRLRTSGGVALLPTHTFMTWTRNTAERDKSDTELNVGTCLESQ